MSKKATFIIHGRLQNKRLVRQIESIFSPDYQALFFYTGSTGHGIELTKRAILDGTDFLIAVGGDGTLNEVVNGLLYFGESGQPLPVLGIIPAGTGNDFARSIGVTTDLQQLKSWMDQDQTKMVDAGFVTFRTPNQGPASRYFINVTDIGIGGVVAQRHAHSRLLINPTIHYIYHSIAGFFSYRHQPVRLRHDHGTWEGLILSICMANGRWFGSGLGIAPMADPSDGKITLVVVKEIRLWDYLKNLGRIRRGQPLDHPEIEYLETVSCSIDSLDTPCPIDMDGEFVGFTPLKMKVIPGKLLLLAI